MPDPWTLNPKLGHTVSRGNNRDGDSIGVVLFQLGGPDSPEAIEPFLYNLFSDPDIIDFPFARLARPTLARLISSRRAKRVQAHYARIGGKSPIRGLTDRQAAALERELNKTIGARVFVAMRYWHPLTEEAVRRIQGHAFRELVLLPLYPQYSTTTTRSSLKEWTRQYRRSSGSQVPVKIIREFYSNPLYLDAVVEKINLGLERFGTGEGQRSRAENQQRSIAESRQSGASRLRYSIEAPLGAVTSDVHLLFSAHGVPVRAIDAGDPYQAQVEATTKLVIERGGWPNPHHLCYQSRVGPGKWLEPSLAMTLRRLATEGAKRILAIPIAFVSDHIETLHEIDIEARELAQRLGIRQFETMPALNDSPSFIQALADLVLRQVDPDPEVGRGKLTPYAF